MRRALLVLLLAGLVLPIIGCSKNADANSAVEIRKQQIAGETADDKASHD